MSGPTLNGKAPRIRLDVAMTLIAVLALNFKTAMPPSPIIHGLGHWIGAIVLEVALIASLYRRRLSPRLVGFEAIGWTYLACRAFDRAPAISWWEDAFAEWLVRVEYQLRGVSWSVDRWYVLEAHVRSIQLVVMLLASSAGGFVLGVLSGAELSVYWAFWSQWWTSGRRPSRIGRR